MVLPVANLALPHELAFILYSLLYWLSSKFIIIAINKISIIVTIITVGVILIRMNLLPLYSACWVWLFQRWPLTSLLGNGMYISSSWHHHYHIIITTTNINVLLIWFICMFTSPTWLLLSSPCSFFEASTKSWLGNQKLCIHSEWSNALSSYILVDLHLL